MANMRVLKVILNLNNSPARMKKLIALVFISLFFTTCKKGEDDPFLSLRSRTNRLAGEWRLSTGKVLITIADPKGGPKYQLTFTFSQSRYNAVDNTGSGSGAYLLSLNIEDDGFFKFHE